MPPLPAVAQPAVAMVELAKPMAIVTFQPPKYDVRGRRECLSVPLVIDKVTFVLPLVQEVRRRIGEPRRGLADAVRDTPATGQLPSVNSPS